MVWILQTRRPKSPLSFQIHHRNQLDRLHLRRELASNLGNNCTHNASAQILHLTNEQNRRKLTMKPNNRENKAQAQNKHNNWINPQPGALIRVKLKHGTGGSARAGRSSRAGARIPERFLVVCGCATTESCAGAAGRCRRGGTAH